MYNVTVLKMKDIVKYFLGVLIIVSIVIITSKYFNFSKSNKKDSLKVKSEGVSLGSLTGCLDVVIPTVDIINQEDSESNENVNENKEMKLSNYWEGVLSTEISSMKAIEEIEKEQNGDEKETDSKDDKEQEITLADTEKVQTEVVTQNPITESYNVQYGNVKIKNQTTYDLTEEMLKPDIQIDNKNILIFHTHSCESYTPSEQYPYTQTGNYRTTDLNYTVTRVGTELENYLKQYNLNVIHNTSYHDYPSYTGSYTRSLETVENILQTSPSDIIIDLHRDAIGSREDYAPTVKIGDDYAAQIMFVIGTNEGGLLHPNWNQNLKFAIKVQEKAEEMYPRVV